MSTSEIRSTAEHKMQQSVESFKNNLTKVRTGRPNPQLLDTVHVSLCLPIHRRSANTSFGWLKTWVMLLQCCMAVKVKTSAKKVLKALERIDIIF